VQAVIETPTFLAKCRKFGISEAGREAIVDHIAQNPKSGSVMPGTGGARKVRFPGTGKGKSGGYRVITFFGGDDIPVFLLSAYAKSDVVTLTKAEQNALKTLLSVLPDAYREGMEK